VAVYECSYVIIQIPSQKSLKGGSMTGCYKR